MVEENATRKNIARLVKVVAIEKRRAYGTFISGEERRRGYSLEFLGVRLLTVKEYTDQ